MLYLLLLGAVSLLQAQSPEATIVNSGSTNLPGFRIAVKRTGVAEMNKRGKSAQRKLAPETIERFYADLKAAEPLAALPKVYCMKSASFGSSLSVEIASDKTPDLSCGDGGNAAMRNLIRDVQEIVALFPNE